MASLKSIVEEHGLPCRVKYLEGSQSMIVVDNWGDNYYRCYLPGYGYTTAMKECEATNDYEYDDRNDDE